MSFSNYNKAVLKDKIHELQRTLRKNTKDAKNW